MILFIIAPNGFASASFDDSKNFKYLNKFPFPPNIYIYIYIWWKFDNSNCKITSALFSYFYRNFTVWKLETDWAKQNKQIRNVNPNCKNNKWQTTKEKLT